MVKRTGPIFKIAATRRLPRRIVPLIRTIKPPGERTLPVPAKTMGLRNMASTRFKDAAQAANMTPADIVRGHGIYGDPAKGNPPV